ncbi:unnamed protein product [Blepharisma stoltei]|uniref:Uncharacterized protein n=1 Tax=Blepharisma stoltei TaxID=1481888 RepID=A0AAU9K9V7_9CILI|nr:unnamed protein product [Blepharisma stoltei]
MCRWNNFLNNIMDLSYIFSIKFVDVILKMDLSNFATVWGNFIDSNDPDLQENTRLALYSLSTLMLEQSLPPKSKLFFTDLQSRTLNWETFNKKIGNVKKSVEKLHDFFKQRPYEMNRRAPQIRGSRWGSDMPGNMENSREDYSEERKLSNSQEQKFSGEGQVNRNSQNRKIEVQNISILDSPRPYRPEESKLTVQPKYLEITEISQPKSKPVLIPISKDIKVLLGKPTFEASDHFISHPYAANTVRLFVRDQKIFVSETVIPPSNPIIDSMKIRKSSNLIQVKSMSLSMGMVFVFGKNEIVVKATNFTGDLVLEISGGPNPFTYERVITSYTRIGCNANCELQLDRDEEIQHFHANLKKIEKSWVIEAYADNIWLWMGMHLRNSASGRRDSNEYQIYNDSCIRIHDSKYQVRLVAA